MASLEKQIEKHEARDMNRDPITGPADAHPVSMGIGAVGALAGELVGNGSGEERNPTGEEAYWREFYSNEPYHDSRYTFEDYAPAFLAGYVYRINNRGVAWDRAESILQADWESNKDKSNLHWEHAKHAAHAAWHRVGRSLKQ